MSTHIPFTDNYQDLSTDQGFQFKFCCERCGNGYMSSFQSNVTNMAGDALRAASNFFGGALGRVANSSYDVQRMIGGPAHDAALRKAVAEISPLFNQCPRCGQWVCKQVCWNESRGQCAYCSPKIDQEIAAIESEGTINQLRQQAYGETDLTGGVELRSVASIRPCPSCNAPVGPGKKFCGECGANVEAKPACPSCGTTADPGMKFCGECGTRL